MSVEKLEFDWRNVLEVEDKRYESIRFIISQHNITSAFELDRSQAHLLMLYLQEKLGNRILTKEEVMKGIDKTLNEVNVFEREIWNAAIEKAAVCSAMGGHYEEIKLLKII